MSDIESDVQVVRWEAIKHPIDRVVVAGFGDRVGDIPGDLPQQAFHDGVLAAFPKMTADDLHDPWGKNGFMTPWSARNCMVERLSELKRGKSRKVGNMTARLAEMAGGDATCVAVAERVQTVLNTSERYHAVPLLGVLSEQIIDRLTVVSDAE